MSARVVSVNVGRPAALSTGRRVVPSAIGNERETRARRHGDLVLRG